MLTDIEFPGGLKLGTPEARAAAKVGEMSYTEGQRVMAELIEGFVSDIERIQEGVYLNAPNLHIKLQGWFGRKGVEDFPDTTAEVQDRVAIDTWIKAGQPMDARPERRNETFINCYGVCDTVEQALEYLRPFTEDPDRDFVVALRYVHRNPENAGKGGGWRWRKWGPYIGTHEIRCEYLDDEVGIERVMLFHVYEILREPKC